MTHGCTGRAVARSYGRFTRPSVVRTDSRQTPSGSRALVLAATPRTGLAERRVDRTTGAVGPKFLPLAWPLVAGNLLQTFYNLADMFWVGRVSAAAVAAVSLVSQHVGANDERAAELVVGQAVLLTVAVGVTLWFARGTWTECVVDGARSDRADDPAEESLTTD